MKVVLALFLMLLATSYTANIVEIEETIEGILVGAFGEDGKAAQDCIHDGEEVFVDIEKAIEYFEKGDITSIANGLLWIGKALQAMPDVLEKCENAEAIIDDIEKIAHEFEDTSTLIVHIGEEIIFHGVSIYHDVTDCVTQFEAEKYEAAGMDIGDIIKILLVQLKNGELNGRTETVEFVEGFFKGSLRDDSADINDCIDDANDIIDELEKIIDDIKEGLLDNVEELFLDFIDLLAEIPRSVVQCEVVPQDLEKYESWILDLKDSKIMEQRLFNAFLLYGDQIKEDSKDLIDDYKVGMWTSSGYHLGDLLYILFEKVSPMAEVGSVLKELLD